MGSCRNPRYITITRREKASRTHTYSPFAYTLTFTAATNSISDTWTISDAIAITVTIARTNTVAIAWTITIAIAWTITVAITRTITVAITWTISITLTG